MWWLCIFEDSKWSFSYKHSAHVRRTWDYRFFFQNEIRFSLSTPPHTCAQHLKYTGKHVGKLKALLNFHIWKTDCEISAFVHVWYVYIWCVAFWECELYNELQQRRFVEAVNLKINWMKWNEMNLNKKKFHLCGYSWKKSTVQRKCTKTIYSNYFSLYYTHWFLGKLQGMIRKNAIFNKKRWKIVQIVHQIIWNAKRTEGQQPIPWKFLPKSNHTICIWRAPSTKLRLFSSNQKYCMCAYFMKQCWARPKIRRMIILFIVENSTSGKCWWNFHLFKMFLV